MYSSEMNNVLNALYIPDADAIRGNICLPETIDNAKITWTSSDPTVITDKPQGAKAAGVVTRGAADVSVKLTASVSLNGETAVKELEVTVLKAPAPISEDDYEGYLFGHFIGEASAMTEQIYFALSSDGLHFKDMNGSKPVLVSDIGEKGVRDPYICRSEEGDRFFLIATDLSIYHRGGWLVNAQGYHDASTNGSYYLVLWESTDLVNWTEPRLIKVAPDNAGMAWAPEIVYNDETGEYVIFFASSIMNPETKLKTKQNAIYYVSTRDFVHISETKIFIDNQADNAVDGIAREIIDTTILKVGDWYFSASKDGGNLEPNGGIRIMKTKTLLDPASWEKVLDLDELGLQIPGRDDLKLTNGLLEGPELFQYNKKDWADPNVPEYGLIADQYAIDGGYLPFTTTDLLDTNNSKGSWKLLSEDAYSFDKLKKRHGTILRITKAELERMSEAYKN